MEREGVRERERREIIGLYLSVYLAGITGGLDGLDG